MAQNARESLVDALADIDDALAEQYLDSGQVTAEQMRSSIRKATLELKFLGVIPGAAFKNKGVQFLMDAVVDYLPSPLDLPPMKAFNADEHEVAVAPDDHKKIAGLTFKLMSDSYVGKLVFFRVYQGTLKKGAVLHNPRTGKTERVSRLMVMKADAREDIEAAFSGDICALVGVRDVVTGDTLCDKSLDLRLEPPSFPDPVISMSIEPSTKADQDKLSVGLQRLSEEDPTFFVSTDSETGQTIISGMGELHLDIIRDRLFREFNVQAQAGKPQIAYREAITTTAEGEGKFIRQSGGRGQYGHIKVKIEPRERGAGCEVTDSIAGGVIPKEFIKPAMEGIREAANTGTVAGYPTVDWKIDIYDGSFHEVDSSEMAFKMAGIFAFREAMAQAQPILLEPVMSVEVTTPDEYQGDVVGDLNRRRGQIRGIESKSGVAVIQAAVSLEAMFGYATDVRSLTKGRAGYTMTPSHFEQVPTNILNQLVDTRFTAPARA